MREWPAIDAAFTFVVPSYQLLTSRFEAADSRLTMLLTFASTITSAAPLFAKTIRPDISFSSPLLWIAVAVFAVAAIAGVMARAHGKLTLPDPGVMHDSHLDKTEPAFKLAQLYWAGEHFTLNRAEIDRKGKAATLLMWALIIEVILLVVWVSV